MANLEDITVQRYLHSATSLTESAREELRKLLAVLYSVCGDWSEITNKIGQVGASGGSNVIRRSGGRQSSQLFYDPNGIPIPGLGNGGLSFLDSLVSSISVIRSTLFDAEGIEVPGLYLLEVAVKNLQECVDIARAQGNSVCANFLPACQYVKGILTMLLENHGYWEAKIAGEKRPHCYVKDLELPTVVGASNNMATVGSFSVPGTAPATCMSDGLALSSVLSGEERAEQLFQGS